MSEEIKESKKNKIVYLGKDYNYFNDYCDALASALQVSFERLTLDISDKEPPVLVLEIHKAEPSLIILDFTEEKEKLIKVAQFISRMYPLRKTPFVAFLTALRDNSQVVESMLYTGVNFLFYKLQEVEFSAIPTAMTFQADSAKFSDFFVKECSDLFAEIHLPAKINCLSTSAIQIESDAVLPSEQRFSMQENIFKRKVLYKKASETTANRYYHYNNSYTLNFEMPSQQKLEDISEEEKKFSYLYEEEVRQQEKTHDQRINEVINQYSLDDLSVPKRLRVLIVDHELRELKDIKNKLDEFSFSIRLHQKLDESGNIMEEVRASIIVYTLRDPERGKLELDLIFNYIEAEKNYSPIVVIFDEQDSYIEEQQEKERGEKPKKEKEEKEEGKEEEVDSSNPEEQENKSEIIQKIDASSYSYDKKLISKGVFEFSFLLKLFNRYKEKLIDTQARDESIVYFSKKDSLSNAAIVDHWRITKMSEPFIVFEPKIEIPMFSIVRAKIKNVNVILTVVPFPQQYAKYQIEPTEKFAIISGVDEVRQGELRHFISSLKEQDKEEKK